MRSHATRLPSGEIDYEDLERNIQKNIDRPVILNVNVGTTVKGAVDNLDKILAILKRNDVTEDRFYIHCDGALFALMLPFLKDSVEVNFEKPIGSMSVSGHKFNGMSHALWCDYNSKRQYCKGGARY